GWLAKLDQALSAWDAHAAAELFDTDSYWRDLIAFTWNLFTAEGRDAIEEMLSATLSQVQPSGWKVTDGEEPASLGGVTEAWIEFETAIGRGKGQLRLKGDGDDARAWTLLTTMYELRGHEEPAFDRRPKGAEHGINRDRESWLDR